MPVTAQTPVISYTASGSATVFAYPYRILEASDLVVTLNGVVTSTGFSVSGVGNQSGGSVTFAVPPPTGTLVKLQRSIPRTRATDYIEGGSLRAETLDDDFDRVVMMLQDVEAGVPLTVENYAAEIEVETFTATAGQTLFTLVHPFTLGANLIEVFVNGSLQAQGTDYVETSSSSITFLAGLNAGDRVQCRITKVYAGVVTSAGLVGYGTGSSVERKLQERISVKDFGAIGDGQTDDTAAVQTAVNFVLSQGGGEVFFPRGTYLLLGVAGLDTYKNGILIPDTNGIYDTAGGVQLVGEGVNTTLKAGSTNMVVVRCSRVYTQVRNMRIDGAFLANVIGVGLIPESTTQTTELVSQSYQKMEDLDIEFCTEGMVFQPGPSVLGWDSGAFYQTVIDCRFNLNTRAVWMRPDITGNSNRTTRSKFVNCTFLRGNTGVYIDEATEIDFVGCNWELIASGTSPRATPTAFYYGATNPSGIRIIGGCTEACTKGIVALHPEHVLLIGYSETIAPDASQVSMGKHTTGRLVIAKPANTLAELSFGNSGIAGFICDPDQTSTKTLDMTINGTKLWRHDHTRKSTFYGTLGNIEFDPSGAALTFTRPGNVSVTNSVGGITLSSQVVNNHFGLAHEFYSVNAATKWMSLDSSNLYLLNGIQLILSTPSTPASSSAAGIAGTIKWDSGFVYVCTATNTWKRAALSTW